jgi:hemoglobin
MTWIKATSSMQADTARVSDHDSLPSDDAPANDALPAGARPGGREDGGAGHANARGADAPGGRARTRGPDPTPVRNEPPPRAGPDGDASSGADPLTPAEIERLVDRFYDRVQRDPVLGPIFNPAVHDWDEHKRTLVKFWSSVALRSGTYRGNPMAAHRPHPIRAAHFEHWLALWRDTADEVLSPAHAALFGDYAARIARSLRYGLGLD